MIMKRPFVSCVLGFVLIAGTPIYAKEKSKSIIEASFNPHQFGDAVELGYAKSDLFKLRDKSRHSWGVFVSGGIYTLYNTVSENESSAKDHLSGEFITGILAKAPFTSDIVAQYGKLALDLVVFDDKINSTPELGGLLESGLEFLNTYNRQMSLHIGLRWRFGFSKVNRLANQIDPVEGLSMLFGARWPLN